MDPTRVAIAGIGYLVLWILSAIVFTLLLKGTNNPAEKKKLSRYSAITISVLMVAAVVVAGAPIGVILIVVVGCTAFYWFGERFTKYCQACGNIIQRPGTSYCPKCGTKLQSEPTTPAASSPGE